MILFYILIIIKIKLNASYKCNNGGLYSLRLLLLSFVNISGEQNLVCEKQRDNI